jgi:hypothetical protein
VARSSGQRLRSQSSASAASDSSRPAHSSAEPAHLPPGGEPGPDLAELAEQPAGLGRVGLRDLNLAAGHERGPPGELGQQLLAGGHVVVPDLPPVRVPDQLAEPVGPAPLPPGQAVGGTPERGGQLVQAFRAELPYPVDDQPAVAQSPDHLAGVPQGGAACVERLAVGQPPGIGHRAARGGPVTGRDAAGHRGQVGELGRGQRWRRPGRDRVGQVAEVGLVPAQPLPDHTGRDRAVAEVVAGRLPLGRGGQPLLRQDQPLLAPGDLVGQLADPAGRAVLVQCGGPVGQLPGGGLQLDQLVRATAEDRQAQRLDLLRQPVPQHPQRVLLLGQHQHPPAVRDQVADQVADGVGLAGPRRALHRHAAVLGQPAGDRLLGLVGGHRHEQPAPGTPPGRLVVAGHA